MGYKLLGMAVWKGGKLYLQRRYGPTRTPKPVLATTAVLALAAALVVAGKRTDRI